MVTCNRPRCVVIGVGNRDRGDDGLGPAAARLLREHVEAARHPGFAAPEIIEHGRDVASLILARASAEWLFLIDACVSGAAPGTICRLDVTAAGLPARALPPGSCHSSHGFGLAAALELARALGRLPPHTVIYAVEASSFAAGTPLSPLLERAAAEVARRVFAELAGDCGPTLAASRAPALGGTPAA